MNARPLLIVDDDPDHVVIARMVVASVAPTAEVETCMDPRVAPGRLLHAPQGAVVLVDRVLAGIESTSVIDRVTAARPDLYVVVWSSSLSEEASQRARDAGAHEVIEKPGSLVGWREAIAGVIDRAAAHGAANAVTGGDSPLDTAGGSEVRAG